MTSFPHLPVESLLGATQNFEQLESELQEISRNINAGGDTGWLKVSFENGWKAVAGISVQYRRIGPEVKLRGQLESGAANSIAFTLPVGYRPSQQYYALTVTGGEEAGYIVVKTSGTVTLGYVAEKTPSIDGANFLVD